MNATEKFALERDTFERQALGLPPRVFANADEKQALARQLLAQEEVKRQAKKRG
jgi:hypothetical protein